VEASPDAYVAALVAVFREVRRVLTDDGTCWVNLGDSHNNSDKWGGGSSSVGKHKRLGGEQPSAGVRRRWRGIEGTKSKDLLMIPAIVALALRTDGWYLRSDIIWAKPNPMPESVTDRPTKSHEHLFLLTKSAKYYYDAKAISEPCAGLNLHDITGSSYVAPGQTPHTGTRRSGNTTRVLGNERGRPSSHLGASIPWEGTTRNKRDVWTVPTQPYMGAHFATMPEALVEPCILAGAPIGGLVLDPFCGSGTVLAVAERLSRRSVGTDLNYQGLAAERIAQRGLMFEEAVS
jgi:DNA modification methylase